MKEKNETLEKLVGENIQKYESRSVGEDDPDKPPKFRNTERLVLTFFNLNDKRKN